MLLKILQYITLFFYVYSIQLVWLPFGIGTRIVLAILGLGLFLSKIKGGLRFNKSFFSFIFILIGLSLISLFSILVNITNDYQFVGYPFSILLILLASYFTFNFFLVKKEITSINCFKVISEGIVYVVLGQSILAFLMFLNPALANFFNSIQVFIELDVSKLEESLNLRLVGFGIKFFAFGIVNGYALILITSLLKNEEYSASKRTFLWISYLLIFIIGMMAARTTVIGFILSLLLLYNPFLKNKKLRPQVKSKTRIYLTLIILVFLFIVFNFSNIIDRINVLFEFGFDLFVSYFQSGSANSESLNQMSTMYIWPTEIETYLIGDGRFSGTGTDFYYKGTDIGWIRLLYYFGIPGTLIYIFSHYFVIKKCIKNYSLYKNTFIIFLLYFGILNFKGFSDIIFLIIPFMFTVVNKNRKYDIQREL